MQKFQSFPMPRSDKKLVSGKVDRYLARCGEQNATNPRMPGSRIRQC